MKNRFKTVFAFLLLSCLSSQAQDIPKSIENDLRTIMYLSEMHYNDSAMQMANELEPKNLKDTSALLYVLMIKIQVAENMNDRRTHYETIRRALTINAKQLANNKEDLAETYNSMAIDLKYLGRLDSAMYYGEKAVELYPANYLYHNLAGIYIFADSLQLAYKAISKCNDPADETYHSSQLRLAQCLFLMDSVMEAKPILEKLQRIERYNSDELLNTMMGDIYVRLKDRDKACEYYKMARKPEGYTIKTHPNNGNYMKERIFKEMLILENKINLNCKP